MMIDGYQLVMTISQFAMERSTHAIKNGKPSISIRAIWLNHGELLVITRPGIMMIEVPGSTLNPLMRKDVVLCKLRGELHVSLYLNQLI